MLDTFRSLGLQFLLCTVRSGRPRVLGEQVDSLLGSAGEVSPRELVSWYSLA